MTNFTDISVVSNPKIVRAHKIRLNPTPEQANYFMRACGIARFVWNVCLTDWKRIKGEGLKASWNQIKINFRARIDKDFPWIREVTKCAVDGAVADLSSSISTYFKVKKNGGKVKFPKCRKRSKKIGSFVLNNDTFWVDGHDLKVPKLGIVNRTERLRFEGKILSGRIKEKAGRWYLCVTVETDRPEPSQASGVVGIDLGLGTLAVLSDDEVAETQGYFRRSEHKLKLLQRGLARKKLGSKRRNKWRLRVARMHEKIANQRQDFLHKLTTNWIRQYGIICLEDLALKGLCRTRLAKSFYDAALGALVGMVEYKTDWYQCWLQKVSRWFPSSKQCNVCKTVNKELDLSDRTWTCLGCGTIHNRDRNASDNIKEEGLRLMAESGSLRPNARGVRGLCALE